MKCRNMAMNIGSCLTAIRDHCPSLISLNLSCSPLGQCPTLSHAFASELGKVCALCRVSVWGCGTRVTGADL